MKPKSKIENHNVLAVIMARAGSVGLPGKAMRLLLGRPVLAYTFDHVRESKYVTRSVVSSDDFAILSLAQIEGFQTIERPAELATDNSATDPVLRHAVNYLKQKEGYWPDAVVMLYGNVPVRNAGMIDFCVYSLFELGCDSVQPVISVGKMHPFWMFEMDDQHKIRKHVPNDVFRRQDLPPLFSPTGAVYAMRTEPLMAAEGSTDPHAFLGNDRRAVIVRPEDVVDIDTLKDLWVAEATFRAQEDALEKIRRVVGFSEFPKWVQDALSLPSYRLFSRPFAFLRPIRIDQAYIESFDRYLWPQFEFIEFYRNLRRKRDALGAHIDREVMALDITEADRTFSLLAIPDSMAVIFWEAH